MGGCTPQARPAARAFAAGCPVLSAAPSGVEVDARVFHAKALADADQIATSDLYADYVTVPESGDDGGFAWYEEASFGLATHSGDAYVVVAIRAGADAAEEADMRRSLRRQVPALTAIMTDMLAAIP